MSKFEILSGLPLIQSALKPDNFGGRRCCQLLDMDAVLSSACLSLPKNQTRKRKNQGGPSSYNVPQMLLLKVMQTSYKTCADHADTRLVFAGDGALLLNLWPSIILVDGSSVLSVEQKLCGRSEAALKQYRNELVLLAYTDDVDASKVAQIETVFPNLNCRRVNASSFQFSLFWNYDNTHAHI